jgi:hypothetical protein
MSKRLRREKSAKKTAKKTVKAAATLKRKSSPSKSRQTKPLQTKSLQTKSPGRQRRAGEKAKMSSEPTASKGNSPSAAAPAAAAAERPAAQIRYLDRADMEETFADSISGLIFDGQTLRIEFAVTRFDEMKANAPITGRRYPACRLVLPPAAAVDLINRMQQIAAALTQAGVVRPAPRPEAPKAG